MRQLGAISEAVSRIDGDLKQISSQRELLVRELYGIKERLVTLEVTTAQFLSAQTDLRHEVSENTVANHRIDAKSAQEQATWGTIYKLLGAGAAAISILTAIITAVINQYIVSPN